MEELFRTKLEIESNFDYKKLFSATKSTSLDPKLNSLLKAGLQHNAIEVEKYLVADNIADELYNLEEWKVKSHKKIKSLLKDWHMESDYSLSPILFVLEKLEPNFIVAPDDETKIYLIQSDKNIKIGYRFASQDAFARLYLSDDGVIINLTSDSLVNLTNCLALENIELYLLDMEWVNGEASRMVAYKLVSTPRYRDVKRNLDDSLMTEIFK